MNNKNDSASPPLIGLTCYTSIGADWSTLSPGLPQDFVFRNYSNGVFQAGGAPLLIPNITDAGFAAEILTRLDGLVLTGGPDIAPREYGEEPEPGLSRVDHLRDSMDFELARQADRLGLPVFGICRGSQVINCAFGGTLFQDIASQTPGGLNHAPKSPKDVNTHTVKLFEGSRLREIMGEEVVWVNSGHHQAIKKLGENLVVCALARDGVVEAVEKADHDFMIGVQWHPEGTAINDIYSQRLFEALVRAAGDYRDRK